MDGPKFEFYVVNYDINKRDVEMYNIFNNCKVYDETLKQVKKYLRSPKKYCKEDYHDADNNKYGFEGFCEELRSIIMWQEWSRCEYEISVGGAFTRCVDDLKKIDCYYQALPNIETIAREVIYQYKEWRKKWIVRK